MSAINKEIFRVIDANFNRTREGLRVCEDVARFMMNSPGITKELKALRHSVSGIIGSKPALARIMIESRNVSGDCGRTPKPGLELSRRQAADVFTANIERVKESIRVLEEFFKIIDIKLSPRLSSLRFKAYAIEKKAARKLIYLNKASA